jgi:hypothetical protein
MPHSKPSQNVNYPRFLWFPSVPPSNICRAELGDASSHLPPPMCHRTSLQSPHLHCQVLVFFSSLWSHHLLVFMLADVVSMRCVLYERNSRDPTKWSTSNCNRSAPLYHARWRLVGDIFVFIVWNRNAPCIEKKGTLVALRPVYCSDKVKVNLSLCLTN